MEWSFAIISLFFPFCIYPSTQNEITCLLVPTTIGIKSTNPEGKNVFKAGESVEITCAKNYWLSVLKKQSGLIRCKNNGHWESPPACEEIACEIPYDQHVAHPYYYFDEDRRLGRSKSYWCASGYKSAAEKATCTEDGWSPNPLCIETGCPAPTIENTKPLRNSKRKYDRGQSVEYQCIPGYEPVTFTIYCNRNDLWDNMHFCTEIECNPPLIEHGTIREPKLVYKENEVLQYECDEKYKPRQGIPKCLKSGWSITAQCEEINCLLGPTTTGIESTNPEGKNVFKAGESVEITCTKNYRLSVLKKKSGFIRCKNNGHWESPPVCEEIACEIPHDQHVAYPYYYFVADRRLGRRKSYWCVSGYKAAAERATCTEDGWSPNPLCIEIGCPAPTIENTTSLRNPKPMYVPGERIEYQCLPGYKPDSFVIYCNKRDVWEGMRSCTGLNDMCSQPSSIPHAIYEVKEKYTDGEIATYECPVYYVKAGDPHLTCRQGKWTGYGKCLEPCTVDVHTMDAHNIQLHPGQKQKIYMRDGDFVQFTCQRNYKQKGNISFRQRCENGVITLPACA